MMPKIEASKYESKPVKIGLPITFEPLIYPHDFLKAIKRLDNGYNQIVLDARSLRMDDLATSIHWRYGRSQGRGGVVIRTT
jgi:hypothetical protein